MTTGYVSGVFDLLHIGHVRFLTACRARCDRLVVGVLEDRWVMEYKRRPMIPTEQRVECVAALRMVDLAFAAPPTRTLTREFYDEHGIRVQFVGLDQKDPPMFRVARELIRLEAVDSRCAVRTTDILARIGGESGPWRGRPRGRPAIAGMVGSLRGTGGDRYRGAFDAAEHRRRKDMGSSSNELLRHLLLASLLVEHGINLAALVPVLMILHSVTMSWPWPMPWLVRRRLRSDTAILAFSALHAGAVFSPPILYALAAVTGFTYAACLMAQVPRLRRRH